MNRVTDDTSAAGATAGSHHEHTRRGHQAPITVTLGRPLSASEDGACLAAGSEGNEDGNGAGEHDRQGQAEERGEVPRNDSYLRHRSHDP